jgi:hypothetical protein
MPIRAAVCDPSKARDRADDSMQFLDEEKRQSKKEPACFTSVLCRPGGTSGEPEPDPIPNSAVKLPSADGTKSQDLEE